MLQIRIKESGEIRRVTRNEAFGLIDAGLAELLGEETSTSKFYPDKSMRPTIGKKYKVK